MPDGHAANSGTIEGPGGVGVAARVHRVEVHLVHGEPDPIAANVLNDTRAALGAVTHVESSRLYLIEAPLDDAMLQRIADELLADATNQRAVVGTSPRPHGGAVIEVHYQPGVMDPVAQSTREAIAEMFPGLSLDQIEVRTGSRYDLHGCTSNGQTLQRFAERSLANTVIQDIHLTPFRPERFQHGSSYTLRVAHVPIRDLDDAGLMKMSREAHLFLSVEEMRAIRDYYRTAGRDPADIEIETLAQTWSEHCVHKTLKSTIRYTETQPTGGVSGGTLDYASRPGHVVNPDGSVTIHNLLKSTVAAATRQLMEQEPHRSWCVSVFKDNSGIVKFDETDAVCIKVETHNHPSAIEPYGGAATGIGGCIRDVMGTGLAAKPIANTDIFCVAFPQTTDVPKGVIPPRRILQQVSHVIHVADEGVDLLAVNRGDKGLVQGAVDLVGDAVGGVLGIIDWEISTLGDPLAELSYLCMLWRTPKDWGGLLGHDLDELGLPKESEMVDYYSTLSKRSVPEAALWEFYMAYNLFRVSCIRQGVYARSLDGTASNVRAADSGKLVKPAADLAWEIVANMSGASR